MSLDPGNAVRSDRTMANPRDRTEKTVSKLRHGDPQAGVVSVGDSDMAYWGTGLREQGRWGTIYDEQGCEVFGRFRPMRGLNLENIHDFQSLGGSVPHCLGARISVPRFAE